MEYLIYLLFRFYNGRYNETNKVIAYNLLKRITKIPESSLSIMAESCFVSESSLNRFCKFIGLANYSFLRKLAKIRDDKKLKIDDSYFSEDNQKRYEELIKKNIELMVPMDIIDKAVRMIHDSEKVIFMGSSISQILALDLQTQLLLRGRFSEVAMDFREQHKFGKNLNKQDLVIITSLNGNFFSSFYDVFEQIKNNGCKIIMITEKLPQEIINAVDLCIICGCSDGEGEGKYGILRIYDIISKRYSLIY